MNKRIKKYITSFSLMSLLLMNSAAMAHENELLGEGLAHNLYHVLWSIVAVVVVVKGVSWWRQRGG